MAVYILLCLSSIGLSFIFSDLKENERQRKRYLFVCGLIMIIVLGLRSRYVGSTDTNNYFRMMERAIKVESWENFYNPLGVEKGFQFWVWGLSRVFKNPQWILIASSAMIVISFLRFVSDNSYDLPTSLLMFETLGLMIFQMQAMRQALAMSVCLWAYKYAKEQKLIKFIFIIFIATLFHRTAVVFGIVYVFKQLKIKTSHVLLFLTGAVVFIVMSNNFIGVANAMFDESYDTAVNSGGFIATGIYILIILFTILFDRDLKYDKVQSMAFYFLLFGCTCYIIRYVGALAAERISFYYMFGQTIVLPNTMTKLVPKQRILIKGIVYVLCILLFMYRLSSSNMIPYTFCF